MRVLRLSCLAALLVCALAPRASSQYLYLDTNGDGVWTSDDRLNPDTTTVRVWLDTNHDRDGSTRVCNDHTGAASTTTTLNAFSYDLILHADGGTVSYSAFASPGFNANGVEFQSDNDATVHRTRALGSSVSGLQIIGYVMVTVTGDSPAIGIASATSIDPTACGTRFGTGCDGSIYPNTYLLGTDWFDLDAVASPSQAPRMIAEGGTLYMGGVLLSPPYDMTFVGRRLTINGYCLPEHPRTIPTLTAADSARYDLVVAAMAMKDRLLRTGLSTTEALPQVRAFVVASPLVGGAEIIGNDVEIQFVSGGLVRIPVVLTPAYVATARVSITEGQARALETLRYVLNRGSVVFLLEGGSRYTVTDTRSHEAKAAISRVLSGQSLTREQQELLPTDVQAQLLAPAVPDRVKR